MADRDSDRNRYQGRNRDRNRRFNIAIRELANLKNERTLEYERELRNYHHLADELRKRGVPENEINKYDDNIAVPHSDISLPILQKTMAYRTLKKLIGKSLYDVDIAYNKIYDARPAPLVHLQDDKRYTITEFPIGGEIMTLNDMGRMYVITGNVDNMGRGSPLDTTLSYAIDVDYVTDDYLSIITQVVIMLEIQFRVGDRLYNWLYLCNDSEYDPEMDIVEIITQTGYNQMISGDVFEPLKHIYTRLDLDFYATPHSYSRYKTFSPLRPALPHEATRYDEKRLSRSEYPNLEVETEFSGLKTLGNHFQSEIIYRKKVFLNMPRVLNINVQ
jgi:hypothetical protein